METPEQDLDSAILNCYREDPGMSAAAIGELVNLSESAVRERTRKLTDSGILRFAAVIDYDLVAAFSLEAYVEVSFPGDADVHEALAELLRTLRRREIREAVTLVGDMDALLRVRTRNVVDLRKLVSEVRAFPAVSGTKTRIVAGRWWHGVDLEPRVAAGSAATT